MTERLRACAAYCSSHAPVNGVTYISASSGREKLQKIKNKNGIDFTDTLRAAADPAAGGISDRLVLQGLRSSRRSTSQTSLRTLLSECCKRWARPPPLSTEASSWSCAVGNARKVASSSTGAFNYITGDYIEYKTLYSWTHHSDGFELLAVVFFYWYTYKLHWFSEVK